MALYIYIYSSLSLFGPIPKVHLVSPYALYFRCLQNHCKLVNAVYYFYNHCTAIIMGELLHLITDFLVQWFVDFENKCSNICQNLVQNKIGRWAQATQNHLSYGCCEIAVTQATQNHLSYGCCELAVGHSKQENEKFDSSEFWSIRVPWFTFFFFSLSLFFLFTVLTIHPFSLYK